jgi:hypothetical protein
MVAERSRSTVVKKTHNVKNNLLCTPDKRIVWLSRTYDGHVHDKKIVDEQPLVFQQALLCGKIPDF